MMPIEDMGVELKGQPGHILLEYEANRWQY